MIGRHCFAFLAFILPVSIVPVSAAHAAGPPSITVDGLQRTYLIEVPKTPGPKPTIILFHGLGGTAAGAAGGSGLVKLGQQQGFVAVFPNGIAHQWNHFLPGKIPPVYAQRAQAAGVTNIAEWNDIDFVNNLIADLVQRGISDPKRIYLAGFSAGGFMVMRMACLEADKFAAVALISSSMPVPEGAECKPSQPLPIEIEKGTADDHVPFNGGLVLDKTFTVWSADQLTAFFTKLDGCSTPAATSQMAGVNGHTIDVSSWTDCAAGPVTFYKENGGVHAIFKVPDPGPTLWNFFKDHSR